MHQFLLNACNGQPSCSYIDVSTFFWQPFLLLHLVRSNLALPSLSLETHTLSLEKAPMDNPALPTAAILHANLMESRVYHELNVVLTFHRRRHS